MKWLNLAVLAIILAGSTGCAETAAIVGLGIGGASGLGNVQTSTRAPEELFLGMGEGPSLFRYAEDLLYQGRYREAHTAYYNCEMIAYTDAVRQAARTRRMYLEELIAAYTEGANPPPPPAVTLSRHGTSQVPPKPNYNQTHFYGNGEISVLAAHPDKLAPHQHYVRDEANFHIYGYPAFPGDIKPEQVQIPSRPPLNGDN